MTSSSSRLKSDAAPVIVFAIRSEAKFVWLLRRWDQKVSETISPSRVTTRASL